MRFPNVAVLIALMATYACIGQAQNFIIAQATPATCDLYGSQAIAADIIWRMLANEPLLRIDNEGRIQTVLAVKREDDPSGGMMLTLRDNVRFSDRSLLEAAHVIHSVKLARDAGRIAAIGQIITVDPRTISIVPAKSGESVLLDLLRLHITSRDGDGRCLSSPGTGPYKVYEFRPGESMQLEANSNWWNFGPGGRPAVRRLTILGIADETSRDLALKSSSVDAIIEPGFGGAEYLEHLRDRRTRLESDTKLLTTTFRAGFVAYNRRMRSLPLDDFGIDVPRLTFN
jgi:ABC-type transport system substrate-binding protein